MLFFFMSNLQTYYHFKLNFPKLDKHTGGKWLIQGTSWYIQHIPTFYHHSCKVLFFHLSIDSTTHPSPHPPIRPPTQLPDRTHPSIHPWIHGSIHPSRITYSFMPCWINSATKSYIWSIIKFLADSAKLGTPFAKPVTYNWLWRQHT